MTSFVLDAAGGSVGGAGRWVAELEAYLARSSHPVTVIGRGRRLTSGWLARREAVARRAGTVFAANNASFMLAGRQRRVLLHNALHFVYPWERHLLQRMPSRQRAQAPVIRSLVSRADVLVVPSQAMGERVRHHLPNVASRIAVRPHAITPLGNRQKTDRPFILVPTFIAPYKDVAGQLRLLLDALQLAGRDLEVRVTAYPAQLPESIAADPRIIALGHIPTSEMDGLWRSADAVLFPGLLESFGYPLAEARVNGIPVLAPDSELAREIAGVALIAYDPLDVESLAAGLSRVDHPVVADEITFAPDAYFRWLLG